MTTRPSFQTLVRLLCVVPLLSIVYCIIYNACLYAPLDIRLIESLDLNAQGKHAAMVRAYEYLRARYPQRAAFAYPLGWAYYKTGRYEEAGRLMDEYVRECPEIPRWKDCYIQKVRDARAKGTAT